MARATVVGAYEQLVAEGFLESRHGSATRVAAGALVGERDDAVPLEPPRPAADFRPGEPDLTSFPRAAWASTTRAVLHDAPASTFAYTDAAGLGGLRRALAAHLGRVRAVVTTPERVFVFSGFADALATLVPLLASGDTRPIAAEEPGLPWHRSAIERSATVVDARVDQHGLDVAGLAGSGAGAILTTPAHQYPLGITLSSKRRAELIDWARDVRGWIIEDDYDGDFRYDRQPVGALQGLAPDRVIYAGTASKALAPGVGIGWLVVPAALVQPLSDVLRQRVTTSTIEQAVLARFVESGGLDRHLRRMRLAYRRRRDDLLAVLADTPALRVRGIAAGLHVTVDVASLDEERALFDRARAASVALLPLSFHYRSLQPEPGFVLGFTRPPAHAWPAALRRLRSVLQG